VRLRRTVVGTSRADIAALGATSDDRSLVGPAIARRLIPTVVAMPEPNGAMSTDLDRAGLAQVVTDVDERHGQALFGFARRLGLGPDQADDAVQEVLMRLYRALEGGTVIDDARGWSFRTIYPDRDG
jgi:hypothetical protein